MTQKIGIIGGSGLYNMPGLIDLKEHVVVTPFGSPSDTILQGSLEGIDAELYFLPRHGKGHPLNPSEVPYRANIFALKSLGVDWIISVSAVGSLQENIPPRDMVLIDQFIDRTKSNRQSTFFEQGIVAHVAFADPICEVLRQYLLQAAKDSVALSNSEDSTQAPRNVHDRGTYVCMEGPAFSTRAESKLYRSWGADVIGMTNLTEAKLAREAEISYATIAMSTDYDCWYDGHDDVTVDAVIAVMKSNVQIAQSIIKHAIPLIAAHEGEVPQSKALQFSFITDKKLISQEIIDRLSPIIGKYFVS